MAFGLDEKQTALLSASLRHVRDAEHLLNPANPDQSIDQAYHLAGFGPECARKAIFSIRWFDKIVGHHLTNTEDLMEFAGAIDPLAQRYKPSDWKTSYPALTQWSESCRYEKTGTKKERDVVW